uniref:Uncharacterized protein n=1 Tax=Moniliophthora roreri TaxID=221103 RepID=A0A0W0G7D5_MONRR
MSGAGSDDSLFNLQRQLIIFLVPTIINVFIYGAYAILFGLCLFFILKPRRPKAFAHVAFVVLLFVLATIGNIFNIVNTAIKMNLTFGWPFNVSLLNVSSTGASIILVIANTVADALLLWRCYLVWGSRVKPIVVPAVLCLANNVAGLVVIGMRQSINVHSGTTSSNTLAIISNASPPKMFIVFLYGTLVSNVILTAMIAGRIYYVIRPTFALLGPSVRRTYKTAIAISLESGVLYPIALLIYAAILPITKHQLEVQSISPKTEVVITSKTFHDLLIQIVGIAPTLIIIRVGLGYCLVDGQCGTPKAITVHIGEESSATHQYHGSQSVRLDIDD